MLYKHKKWFLISIFYNKGQYYCNGNAAFIFNILTNCARWKLYRYYKEDFFY